MQEPLTFEDKSGIGISFNSLSNALAKRWAVIVLIALAGLIALDRVEAPAIPINVDPASYAVVSHELLAGKKLYTDIWDHKPPAPFITYAAAELALGYSPQMLFVLNFVVCLVVLLGVYLAAKQGPGGEAAGVIGAFLWALASGSLGLEGRDPNTEPFIDACVVFAFYLIAANRKDGMSALSSLIVGALFLWASLYKPVVAANVVFITLAFVLFAENRKRAIWNTLLVGGVGIVGWLSLFAYFSATGRGDIFYKSLVIFNGHYSGNILANIAAPLFGKADLFIDVIGPLAVFAIVGTLCAYLYEKRSGALIAAFGVSSWIAVASAGRFSVHYYQMWIPALVIASAWGVGYFLNSGRIAHKRIAYAASAVLVGLVVFYQVPLYRAVYAKEFTPQLPVLNTAGKTVDVIKSLLRDDETFYLWGNTPNLYLLTNRRPPAAVLFDNHLRQNPLSDELGARVREQLESARPELLIVEQGRPAAPEWLMKDYGSTPVYSDPESYKIYARRGGRISREQGMVD